MISSYIHQTAQELQLKPDQVAAVVAFLADNATVPFIARYRKEATGMLDEVAITRIRDRVKQLQELKKRCAAILESVDKQGKLSPELKERFEKSSTLAEIEDLYLPYKPKRRTRGMIARENGLESLARDIFSQDAAFNPVSAAQTFINPEKGLESVDLVLAGARDIIAEWVNEDADARAEIRNIFLNKGYFQSKVIKGKEEEGLKFKDYFTWQESVATAPSHRVLAARRGEKETILVLRIVAPEEKALEALRARFLRQNRCASIFHVDTAIEDGYRRLMVPSIENEVRLLTKERADHEAIKTFAENLKQLLMAPPLGARAVMGIDPGIRTGCKIVCLNPQGKLLEYQTVYLQHNEAREREGAEAIKHLCKKHLIDVIAIGNGTASRETESFIRGLGQKDMRVVVVNESGASYYSASDVARKEFPDLDVSIRGAISIGRRLQDPLAELVKLDPKNIGVGQYQHDVDQSRLKEALDDVIISCVNQVGVDINTASRELLMYVSGVGPALAQGIVDYRNKQGAFHTRHDITHVPRFNAKVFEQAAGFMRVINGSNPLDASAVHPESYMIVEQMAEDVHCSIQELILNERMRQQVNLSRYVTPSIGMPTLRDIMNELAKPGRDPRAEFEFVHFKDGITAIEDLLQGMVLPGVVTNIIDFGCFVDIGVHQDGLVHISEMADKFVKHPSDIVRLHQPVMVRVKDVDLRRKRIALSMKIKA